MEREYLIHYIGKNRQTYSAVMKGKDIGAFIATLISRENIIIRVEPKPVWL